MAGAVVVLFATAPGHRLVRRIAVRALQGAVTGRVTIGSVGGNLLHEVVLDDVTLETPDGQRVIHVERVSVTFALTDLLRSRFRFSSAVVVRPIVVLEQSIDGTWNIERLFGLKAPRAGSRGRRPWVDLRDARVVDGTLIVREHKSRDSVIARAVYTLNADFSTLRLSHPDSAAIEASFRSLAGRVRNPDLVITQADGVASLDGDSLRFALRHVAMPRTTASASGLVHWGGAHTALDASVTSRAFAFDDVRALVPLPLPREGGGSVSLRLRLGSDGSNEFDFRESVIHSGRSAINGRVRLTLGARGGVSVRGMDVTMQPLDLALLRPYAVTLPVRGLVRGRVHGDGVPANLVVAADVAWTDESVQGAPVNTLSARGGLSLGGARQLFFQAFVVNRSDVDLTTLQRFALSLDLPGRLRAGGVLDGPWRDAAFRGTLVHAGDGPDAGATASQVRGTVRLGLRDTLRIDADLDVDSLSLDLLRQRYPAIPLTGTLTGRASVHGPLSTLAVEGALRGDAGSFTVKGTVGAADAAVAVSMEGAFDSLDLSYASLSLPPSVLGGLWDANLVIPRDSGVAGTGTAHVTLGPGVVSGVAVAGGAASLRLDPSRATLDSARLDFEGGAARASGGVGREGGLPGRIDFSVRADTVAYLEPLARWLRSESGDSTTVRLEGAATLTGHLDGTTRAWRLEFAGGARGMQLGDAGGHGVSVQGRLDHGPRGYLLAASAAADTLSDGGLVFAPVGVRADGRLDSLSVQATAGFHVGSALRTTLTITGDSVGRRVRLDSLDLDLPGRSWHLARPTRLAITDSVVTVDSLELRSRTGGGLVSATGVLPRAGAAHFDLVADSVPVVDLYALAQRDTSGVSGDVAGTVRLEGRAEDPRIDLLVSLANGHFGDYRLPLVRVGAHYRDRRLALEGGVWRDSLRLLALTGSLPIDLALRPVGKRELAGPLTIAANADSLDMAVLNPLTKLFTGLSGIVSLDVRIGGTWDQPKLAGVVDVWNGTMRVPTLGAHYTGIDARFTLEDDVMRVARASIQSDGGGRLDVAGEVHFESLTHPLLDLTLTTSRFAAFDIRTFGSLTASGALTLRGPAIGATLSGRIEVDAGSLQFRDLVEKRVVSLDDPEFQELVDTNLSRAAELGPPAHVIFIDSLRVHGLTVALGSDVWLRSSEANVQLDGDFDVERSFEAGASRYRLDGTLHAVRGTYRLTLGKENSFLAISRDFRVTRGTVRFFGTPDFNPELDIAAEHVVRAAQGAQLTVRALIVGTLLHPELHLESDAQPPLTETEIVSYLMFGQPPASLGQPGASGRSEAALAQSVGSSLVGGVGQALASELGLSLDYLTIVPGAARPGATSGVGTARLEAGTQLGERTFLTLNAGLCEVLAAQLVGATLEYRLSGRWTASASFEPVIQECGTAAGLSGLSTRKQFGFDLFWQQGIR